MTKLTRTRTMMTMTTMLLVIMIIIIIIIKCLFCNCRTFKANKRGNLYVLYDTHIWGAITIVCQALAYKGLKKKKEEELLTLFKKGCCPHFFPFFLFFFSSILRQLTDIKGIYTYNRIIVKNNSQ